MVEPYLITLTHETDVFPTFQHAGLEFLFMLEGNVVYRHGDKTYDMHPGDALFPFYLAIFAILLLVMTEKLTRKVTIAASAQA